jgi:hypothetical protein
LQSDIDAATAAFLERDGVVSVHGPDEYKRDDRKIKTRLQKQLLREQDQHDNET